MIFPDINSFPTYWENGMKLSADHFRHLENSIEDAVRDSRAAAALAAGGFGLLPDSPFTVQSAQGMVPHSVRVILQACRAILPGGYRVEILPGNISSQKLPLQAPFAEFVPNPGVRYHLYLSVDAQRRVPAGIPQTRPIRHPYLCPDYRLECISHHQIDAAKNPAAVRMKIAEWQDGKVVEGYIPPSLTVSGFPLLQKWYLFLQNQLENIVRIAAHVINENRRKDTARTDFCLPLVHFIRSNQGWFNWRLPDLSPVELAVYFGNLAGLTDGLIESSDRDFVRNVLKNGQINDLRANIRNLSARKTVSREETALIIGDIQQFTTSLISTLNGPVTKQAPAPRMGERKISSG